ncbi:hypothetical protein [Nocardia neocaledoniensis]|uniref:hypothetical protein n=1 Tax=Nocardia neocaledoniensis TaxID=236511 RepID=UPI0024575BE8|nr:hypothetical protein [Nocardia neocaledoniensis]
MNHAEHDESIGSMLASIAAALREVSDKLDIVAARVQHEVPTFPADDDLPEKTRIHRLESWAFHASQDISRLSSRLDALDGGDTPPRTGRSTPSRREVREAAERAAAEAELADEAARPPLERRSPRTDHLGDPTWPLTVAPIPRAAGEAPSGEAGSWSPFSAPGGETRSEQTGESGGVSTTLAHDMGAARDAASAERRNGSARRNGAAAHGAREDSRNGAATVGGVALDSGRELNGAGAGLAQGAPSAGGRVMADEPTRNGAVARNGGAAVEKSASPAAESDSDREVTATPRGIRTAADGRDGGSHRPIAPVEAAVPGTVGGAVSAGATETSGVAEADSDERTGGHRSAEIAVERARPAGRIATDAESTPGRTGSVGLSDGPASAPAQQMSGSPQAVGASPRSAGSPEQRTEASAHSSTQAGESAQRVNGHAHGAAEARGTEPGSGGSANGIHWTFADDDTLTATPPVRNGHDRNGFTGGDVRDQLPSAPSPAAPPARLSVPKSRPAPTETTDPAATSTHVPTNPADGSPERTSAFPQTTDPAANSTHVPTGITNRADAPPERTPGFPQTADSTVPADTRAAGRGPADSLVNGQNSGTGTALSGFSATVELTQPGSGPLESVRGTNPGIGTGPDSRTSTPDHAASADGVLPLTADFTAPERFSVGDHAPGSGAADEAAERPSMTARSAATGDMSTGRGSIGETSPTGIPLSADLTAPSRNSSADTRSEAAASQGTRLSGAPAGFTPGSLTSAADSAGPSGYTAPASFQAPADERAYTGHTPSSDSRGLADGPSFTNGTGSVADQPGTADFGAPVAAGGAQTSPFDRVSNDPAPPTATDAAGITVTGTYRAFDIERAHVDKLQAMLDELKRSAGLPPGRRDVFGPPTTDAG